MSQVILVDTIGELPSLYPSLRSFSLAAVSPEQEVITSSSRRLRGFPMITGPYAHNFKVIMETFVNGNAIVQLPELTQPEFAEHLAGLMSDLISDKPRREILVANALRLIEENRGATDRVLSHLESMISGNSRRYRSATAQERVIS